MTELRDKLLAPCSIIDSNTNKVVDVDAGALILRLLLFERNVLDSVRLGEFPHLIKVLGFDQVMLLLQEGCLEINCDARTFAQTGRLASPRQQALPLGSYRFNLVTMPNRDEYLSGCLHEMQSSLAIPLKKTIKLKKQIIRRIVDVPDNLGKAAVAQLERDLMDNRDVSRISLAQTLERAGKDFDKPKLRLEIEALGNSEYRTSTNLSSFGVEPDEQQALVERALLGVGGLNLRLERMKTLMAISGFRDEELPIFDAKVNFLAAQITPEAQVDRFQRVVTLAGLPDPGEALAGGQSIDIEKLLKVRDTEECREFRTWLRSLDQETDKDIEDRVNSLKAKVAEAFQSKTGRAVRFGAIAGSGFIPVAGLAVSLGLGALDNFALDRILGDPGPSAFLSKRYGSLFTGS